MEYPRHLYRSPGPFGSGNKTYDLAGAEDEAEEKVLLKQGWHLTKEAAWGIEPPGKKAPKDEPPVNPPDQDGDGKPGGSKAPDEDVAALRVAYADKLGKKPFPGWDANELRKRIADAK